MAVARPIRMLGAACIILVLFLVFQVNKGPSAISIKGSQPYEGIKSDPLLERSFASPLPIFRGRNVFILYLCTN